MAESTPHDPDEWDRDREAWNLPDPRTALTRLERPTEVADPEDGEDRQVDPGESPWSAAAA